MTIAACNARLLTLTMYKSDLEYRIISVSNRRQQLAYQSAALSDADFNEDPRVEALQLHESALELEQKNLETQQKAVVSEYEGLQKLLESNIKKDFKIDVGG